MKFEVVDKGLKLNLYLCFAHNAPLTDSKSILFFPAYHNYIATIKPNWAMSTFGGFYFFALFDVLNIALSF